MISVKRGDEVTVQLRQGKPLEIAVVASAGPALIELTDGRLYFASDGRSIRSPQFSAHRASNQDAPHGVDERKKRLPRQVFSPFGIHGIGFARSRSPLSSVAT